MEDVGNAKTSFIEEPSSPKSGAKAGFGADFKVFRRVFSKSLRLHGLRFTSFWA